VMPRSVVALEVSRVIRFNRLRRRHRRSLRGRCWLVQSSLRSIGIAVIGSTIPLRRRLSARPCGLPDRASPADDLISTARLSSSFAALQGLARTTLADIPSMPTASSAFDFR